MTIHPPLGITSRLLPGVEIGGATISIEYYIQNYGRQYYRWYIDLPEFSDTGSGLQSGVGGGSLQEGLESLLGFLGAFAEAIAYQERICAGEPVENSDLFPVMLGEWATDNADEISSIELELQEHPNQLIVE